MAVGGSGVRVPSTSAAPGAVEGWGRKAVTTAARRGCAGASIRCSSSSRSAGAAAGGLAEEHYRTLRLRPGASRGEVKKAFRRLTLMYHPDVCKQRDDADAGDCAVRELPEDQRRVPDADEQHEGGRGAARVLAPQVRPLGRGPRQVQVLRQRPGGRRVVRHVKKTQQQYIDRHGY